MTAVKSCFDISGRNYSKSIFCRMVKFGRSVQPTGCLFWAGRFVFIRLSGCGRLGQAHFKEVGQLGRIRKAECSEAWWNRLWYSGGIYRQSPVKSPDIISYKGKTYTITAQEPSIYSALWLNSAFQFFNNSALWLKIWPYAFLTIRPSRFGLTVQFDFKDCLQR